ncbi:hypothetical protein [Spiroplasma endosymbiont of Phyllotreta cruciferae]|uniref:hypothetical protein n=1 Tax=Spiroplasma endosymbiont of Phyllotreta cruciferae TaxID=2886375 RepID=UPI0020A0B00E|nr:hypothetical protein [Spiroplasma endosymbiont of Phyllotreta cruciferae]
MNWKTSSGPKWNFRIKTTTFVKTRNVVYQNLQWEFKKDLLKLKGQYGKTN